MKSMTAYGRSELETKEGTWIVEIASVNRKNLEVQVFISRHLLRLEFNLRKWITPFVHRGQVTVRAQFVKTIEQDVGVDLASLKKEKEAWDKLALELGYDPLHAIDFKFLIEQINAKKVNNESVLEDGLHDALIQAVDFWQSMRAKEGRYIQEDFLKRIDFLQSHLLKIEALYPQIIASHHLKLRERLQEFCSDIDSNEERILREVVLLAEKWDVTEEITRIRSHLTQFVHSMDASTSHLGKTLEFLVQEMHREINTLGAKTGDLDTTRLILDMKTELEKIREQVQNVE